MALQYADRCRDEGRLMEAEAVCCLILEARPNMVEAMHLLGVIAPHEGDQRSAGVQKSAGG
jgi:hypothetical protein